jgi:hypothetical protein
MLGLCKYKNALGVPGKGVHGFRILDIAVWDVFLTIVLSAGFAYWMKWNIPMVVGLAFLSGIILHRAFCVRTTIDKFLFPNVKDT